MSETKRYYIWHKHELKDKPTPVVTSDFQGYTVILESDHKAKIAELKKDNLYLHTKWHELLVGMPKIQAEGMAYLGGYLIDNYEYLFSGGENQIQQICIDALKQLEASDD
jgi:hypothetical protein